MTRLKPEPLSGVSGSNLSHPGQLNGIPVTGTTPEVDFSKPPPSLNPPVSSGPPPVIHHNLPPPIFSGPPPVIPGLPPGFPNIPPPVVSTPTVTLRREYPIPVLPSSNQPVNFQPQNQPQFYHSTPPKTEPPPMVKADPEQTKEEKLGKLYVLYPTIWQGFVSIKKQVAMVQLHHISGNQHVARSVLPKELSVPSSDGSNHPALRVSSRVKLGTNINIFSEYKFQNDCFF